MPLTTRCARCGHLFAVSAQQLKGQRGRLDCPRCGARVDALAGLIDEPAFPADRPPRRNPNSVAAPRRAPDPPRVRGSMIPAAAPVLLRAPTLPVRPRRSRGALARTGLGLTILALSLALGAQVAWWKRADLLRDPRAVQVLSGLCDALGCTLPLARLPGALRVIEPSLTPDPASGAMMLRLRIQNQAELPQPAPLIELELLDQQGDPAAVRRFTPDEYAAAAPLAPGESRSVALTLALTPYSGFKVRLQ